MVFQNAANVRGGHLRFEGYTAHRFAQKRLVQTDCRIKNLSFYHSLCHATYINKYHGLSYFLVEFERNKKKCGS